MADIESNIKVNIDTSDALAQLKLLQQQISAFQQAMRNAGQANAQAAAAMQQNLVNSINATGKFRANIQTIKTSAESFTEALEKNKMSIGEYFRYAGGASKTFGKLFKSEFATIQQVAEERVKTLQTQFIKLGRDANGAMKAIAVRPLALDMDNLSVKTQMAAQRQQLFNQLMKQGSTQLLNFGKNTQWAGRQLMVGFTVPLTMMGAAAAKAYMQIEAASIKFKRVYGDMNTTSAETGKMVKQVQALANEFTKYGLAVADTMDMAAQAAAMGKTGADLLAQIDQSAKLAVLGGVDQAQALETTISLTNAFAVSADKLSGSIDFLNAVENQTVLSIEDLTVAIPKAAPVIQQLGGDVKDLAFFMTAMKEGGINASEGANAIKSGLASLINPTAKASQFLAQFGINVKGIVEADKGDIRKTVIDFARALDTLDPLNRARAIEQMFGKFQFSRISTLFQNVIAEGSQATKVAGLANSTAEELAVLSEREMKKIEDSPMFKFQKSVQDMQAKLAPVGEAFLKAITPIVEFVGKILDGFNNLSEGSKQFITILVTAVAGIGPVLLMGFGLIANGVANVMKLFTNLKTMINKSTKPSDLLGQQVSYMSEEQLRAGAIAASLDQAHAKLKQTFDSERTAVEQLTKAYRDAVQAQQGYAGIPGVPVGNPNATPPKKYARGTHTVPGPAGAGDIVPALLSPGEAVIPAKQASKYRPIISGMIAGNLPGFESGTSGVGLPQMRQSIIGPLSQKQTEGLARTAQQLDEISKQVITGPYGQVAPTNYGVQISPTTGHSFPAFGVGGIYQKPDGSKVFVKPQMDLVSAMAEMRGTQIARDAHGLQAPSQKIGVMMDPTDPQGQRRFIVLESPVDDKFANIPTSFTKDQYFKQLVASLLRGDKDLGLGNLGGDVLADVGTAGVFQRASGKRELGGKINSMEEQAIINLLGVKGGAKRFFAEATAEIVKGMTPAEYATAMQAEIQSVMPRLQGTIAGFGNLNPDEKAAYQNMLERLQAGLSVDWTKYHAIHSAVQGKKYSLGVDPNENNNVNGPTGIPVLDNLLNQSKIVANYSSNIASVNDSQIADSFGIQDTHIVPELSSARMRQSGMGMEDRLLSDLQSTTGGKIDRTKFRQSNILVLANVTARMISKLNQKLKADNSGVKGSDFKQVWQIFQSKFDKLRLVLKRGSGVDSAEGSRIVDILDNEIIRNIGDGELVTDGSLADKVSNILATNPELEAIRQEATKIGTVRSLKGENATSASEDVWAEFATGNVTPNNAARFFTNVFEPGKEGSKLPGYRPNKDNLKGSKLSGGVVSRAFPSSIIKTNDLSRTQDAKVRKVLTSALADFVLQNGKREILAWINNPETQRKVAEGGEWRTLGTVPPEQRPQMPLSVQDLNAIQIQQIEGAILKKLKQDKLPLDEILRESKRPDNTPVYPHIEEILNQIGLSMNRQKSGTMPFKYDSASAGSFASPGSASYESTVFNSGNTLKMRSKNPKDDFVFLFNNDYFAGADSATARKSGVNFFAQVAKLGNIPGYADGVFSVPGPKGAGDVVPAMLSPGEAVIPAKKAQRYQPLIQQMVHGTIPGYEFSNVPDTGGGGGMYSFGNPMPVAVVKDYSTPAQEKEKTPEEIANEQDKNANNRQKTANAETKKGFGDALTKAFTRTQTTGKIQSALYGATAVLGAASMVPGQIGQAAQQALPSIGAMTASMQMIPGPAGVAVGAIAALGTITMQILDHWKKLGEEARTLGEAMGTGSKAIGKFAEFAKKATATEIMNKRRETSASAFYNVVEGKQTFGESYMQTDNGKQLVKDVGQAVKSVGLKQAKQLMVNQLTTAVVSGALSPAQARSVAANLGAQLGDMQFGIEVIGKMSDLIGPDGKNLKNNPVEVRMKIVQEQTKQFEQVAAQQQKAYGNTANVIGGAAGNAALGGVAAGGAAFIGGSALATALGGAAAGTSGAMIGAIAGSQFFGPVIGGIAAIAILTKAAVDAQGEIVKNAGYLSASLGSALATQQQMVDSLQIDYEKRIESAKATGDMAEARRLEKQYLVDQAQLLDFNKAKTQEMYDILNQQGTGLGFIFNAQAANVDAAAEGLKKAFEGTGLDVQANMAVDTIKAMQSSDAQKTMLLSAVGQKQIGLNQIQTAGQLFGGSQEGADTLQKMMENSPIELNRALGLAGSMSAETGKKFIVDMSLANPMAAKQMNDALEMAQKTTGVFFGEEKTAKAVMEFAVANPELMAEFQQNIKDLQDVDGKEFTISVAQKILGPNLAKALGEKSVGAYFNKYNKQNKIVFLSEFQQVMTMLQEGDTEMLKSFNTWNATNGYKKTHADYAAWQADRTVTDVGADNTKVPGVDTAGDGGTGPSASFLDPYVQTLREAVRLGQRITVGWKDSLAALKNYSANAIKTMSGQAVLLKQAGASDGLIQAFLGGSEEDQNKMFARAKGGISDVARFIIKQTKLVEDAKIGMEYILAGATGQMEKDNQLYQAALDVISAKEKKINEKYDKRIKALDEIGKMQERNNQQEQDSLDIADALSKGDIAAAARAAMKFRQNEQKAALERAREGIENARKNELAEISTKVLGETVHRDELEARIAVNAEKIAIAKKNELDHQISIGKQALENAKTVTDTLNTLKGYSKIKLPKIGGSSGGGTGGKSGDQKDDKDQNPDNPPAPTIAQASKGLKNVASLSSMGSTAYNYFGSTAAKLASGTAGKTEKAKLTTDLKNAQGAITAFKSTYGGMYGTDFDYKELTSEQKGQYDTLLAKQQAAQTALNDFSETDYENSLLNNLKTGLPKEVLAAYATLKAYREAPERQVLAAKVKTTIADINTIATKNGDTFKGDVSTLKKRDSYSPNDKTKVESLLSDLTDTKTKLATYDSKVADIEKALTDKGYNKTFRKVLAGYAVGGFVKPKYFNVGGSAWGLGTDTIPAMLTPGEFVMRKSAVDSIGVESLNAMNNGTSAGESVYNYSITVNATGNMDANDLARRVMEEIKRVDSQRIRSNNY